MDLTLPAPAKLNLYLHITGKRADGYHTLNTVFQLIDWSDTVRLNCRDDGNIVLHTPIDGLPNEQHLAIKAAYLLKQQTQTHLGADIWVEKVIPAGAGLGGGSSDAATTLMGLNQLWDCNLTTLQLQSLGLKLGADVPFFCTQSGTANATGIGELLTPCNTALKYYIVIIPNVHVSTPTVFKHSALTFQSDVLKNTYNYNNYNNNDFNINDIFNINKIAYLNNDLQAVAQLIAPVIGDVIQLLSAIPNVQAVKMSGTGSSVFAVFDYKDDATQAFKDLESYCVVRHWHIILTQSLKTHPIIHFL